MPTGYTLADNDQALIRPGMDFADRLDVEPVKAPRGHEALLTNRDNIAKALLELL